MGLRHIRGCVRAWRGLQRIFAALLDPERGYFCIQADLKNGRTKQLYLPDTNVLLTRFLSDDGIAEMILSAQ